MNWALHVERLQKGETVSFRPKGNSMTPRILSGNLVTVSPDLTNVEAGDILFSKVHGNFYVHLVKAVKTEGDANSPQKSYLIGNNKGRINGWTKKAFGKIISIED